MDAPLREALRDNASLSIIGMGKNAGKTTVLNRLIALLRADGRVPALTSIGRDGENVDIVTGTEKPGIWVDAGTLVATATDMLRLGDVTRELLELTGIRTPLGEVVIFRALSDGLVQLAGPSMNDQLVRLSETLRALGAEIILIDGAISRKSLAAPAVSEATILCAGASYSPDMDTVIADTAYACGLLRLPKSDGEHDSRHLVEGALTDVMLAQLAPRAGDEIAVGDSSRILLSRARFEQARRQGVRFTVQRPGKLCCVCVNPYSVSGMAFDARRFLEKMREALPVPVVDVLEGGR